MRYQELIAETDADYFEVAIPQHLYHGTFEFRITSIMKTGLGGDGARRNYSISRSGVVYLSDDPDACDSWASDSEYGMQGELVVLVIDTTQLDHSRFIIDENDPDGERGGRSYAYRGVIPPSALTTLW